MMIAEIAVLAIEEVEDHMLHTVWPILLLTFIQITLAYLSLKFQGVRRFSTVSRPCSSSTVK